MGGVKKGCLGFVIVLLLLAAGAGLSVLLRGKYLKPKGRSLVISRSERTLEKIQGEFAQDVSEVERNRFTKTYERLIREMTDGGAQQHERLGAAVENLQQIRSDGIITAKEAATWIELVSQSGAPNLRTTPRKE